jgi:hypothetical protein
VCHKKCVFAFQARNSLPVKLLENLKRNIRYPSHAPSASIRKDKSSKCRKILPLSKLQRYRSKSMYLRGQNHRRLHYRNELRNQKQYFCYSAPGTSLSKGRYKNEYIEYSVLHPCCFIKPIKYPSKIAENKQQRTLYQYHL